MTSSPGFNQRSDPTLIPVEIVGGSSRTPSSPEWPIGGLNVDALHSEGWHPVPFREFVLKLSGRCNLACRYCYMFEMADQSWRSSPPLMGEPAVAAAARRIAEHIGEHALQRVKVIFHGGEPLLGGIRRIAAAATIIRDSVPPSTHVDIGIQTNGVLLNESVLRTLLDHGIGVGVSIDGGAIQHDRHRRFRNGRGSYAMVAEGLALLGKSYRQIFTGLLCTIDVDNDPLETYEALLQFGPPPTIDFLLPHGNWTSPPPRRDQETFGTPYADWLITVFERWYTTPHRTTAIRLFDEIISLTLGGPSRSEAVGLTPVGHIVVDTDGSIEQVDSLRSAYDGAATTGLDVFSHSFDDALAHPAIVARQIGVAALSDTCRGCSIADLCGAGFYPHRYRAGEGYRNPSVFCPDLFRLITHIRGRVRRDTVALLRS